MAQADGTILIDTEIDADGMKAGSNEVEAAVRRMAGSLNDLSTKAKTSLNKQVNAFSKLNQEFAAQQKKVDDLKKKVAEYSSQKIPTAEYAEIQNQISKATEKMNKLLAAQERFVQMGGKLTSNQYKKYQYDIEELANTIRYAEGELRDLEETGKAFTFGNKTKEAQADMERLAAAERKLSDMNNRLGTSYSSIKGTVNDYKNNLLKASDAQNKASSTGKNLSKSLKDTGRSAKSASLGISRMVGLSVLYSFVFRAISGVMNAMKEGFTNLAQYSSETNSSISMLWSSLERLKNSIATAFAPILNVVAPILSKFIDMISTAASYVSMFFSFLSGKSTYTRAVAVQKDYAASLEDTAQSAQDVADATDEAAKAAEGYLSPIDEINKYTSQNDGSAIGGIGDLGGTGESDQPLFEEVEIPNNFIKSLNNVYKILKKIKDLFKKGFWDGLGDYKPALEDLQNDLKSIGTSLADIFTDSGVQNAAKNFVKTLAYSIGQNVGSFVSIGLTIARNIIGGLEKYLSQNKNRIKKYLVSVFDVGSEILSLFGNFSKTLAEVISKTFGSETAQQITGNVIGIFAEVGMLISSLGLKLMSDIANIILSPFIENKDKITQAILGTLEAIEPFTTGLLIAVQTIADSLTRLYDEHISPLFESIKNGLSTILSAFVDGYNTYLLPILQALGDKFQELMEGPFGEMVLKVEGFISRLIDALKLLWESVLVPFFTWLAEKFFPIISPAIEAIGKVALEVIEFIIKAIGNIADTLSGIIDFIVGVFTGDWELAWTGIQEIFKGIWDLILNILDTAWEIIKETISGGLKVLKTLIQTAWEGIKTVTSTAWEYISNFLVDTWETLKGKVKDAFNFIKEKVNNAWDSIKEKAQTVWERLSTWIPEKVEDIRKAIVEKFENAIERVKEVFSNIVDFIKAPINEAIGLVNGAIGAINNAIGGIESAFSFGPWEIPTPFGTRTIGFRATFPRVGTIPYLASGAVIPPNKEFLAVLGDQKQGTNIEAPLSTIEQAVRNVIGDGGNAQYRIPIYINGRQILEAVVDEGELKRRRSGSNPFALGGA